ncbi:MAG: GNAT family N-acetyltransferase [bacterium]|nr:GNAT family N-acetyltransferase [bacterium]
MQIQSIKNANIQNFGSENLFSARINKYNSQTEQTEPVDVFITRLEASDTQRVEKNIDDWQKTDFGAELYAWLKKMSANPNNAEVKKSDLYAIEALDKDGTKTIKAMALATDSPEDKAIFLDILQTLNLPEQAEKLKGAGSCLMYALMNLAKQRSADTVSLEASTSAIPFYQKLGFDSDRLWHFLVEKDKIDELEQTLKEKYSIEEV